MSELKTKDARAEKGEDADSKARFKSNNDLSDRKIQENLSFTNEMPGPHVQLTG